MLGVGHVSPAALGSGLAVMAAVLSGGLVYFGRSEAASVDRL
jgi:hypothetical protein